MAAWEQESVESLQARHLVAVKAVDSGWVRLRDAIRDERVLAAQTEWALTKPGRLSPLVAEAEYDAAKAKAVADA